MFEVGLSNPPREETASESARGQQPNSPAVPPGGKEPNLQSEAVALREARSAIGTFLASFGLPSETSRSGLIEQLIEGAQGVWREQPEQSLEQCALQHAEQEFEAWLGLVLGNELLGDRSPLLIGRAAFLLCGGPDLWADVVLVCDDLPQPFVEAMRSAAPAPTPNITPGVMSPQQLESWSMADAAHMAGDTLAEPLAWAAGGRELRSALIKS